MSETDTGATEAETLENGASAPDEGDPWKAVSSFVREHPGLMIGGGIAAGLLAGTLIPKRVVRNFTRRATQLAEIAGTAGIALSQQAWEKAESAGTDLRERGAAAAERLETYGEAAAERAEQISDSAKEAAGKAGKIIAEKASELKSRVHR